tara:strand:- start:523 stop:1134 length:612 start_codon:yes stop_codon:yes gene_type:complete
MPARKHSEELPDRLSKAEINELPLVRFQGAVRIAENSKSVARLVQRLSKQRVLGFDIEAKPTFRRGPSNPAALLQFATADQAFLFRLRSLKKLGAIKEILSNPNIIKAGVAIRDDIKKLQEIEDFEPRGFEELANLAGELKIVQTGLRSLTAIFFGHRLSKSAQLSNWEKNPLAPGQVNYAATDAWISRELYLIMKARLKSRG